VRVTVDDDRCAGHGVCFGICPDVFQLSDDGYAVVIVGEVPPELHNVVNDAIDRCPERAISTS
jgi:ferredoxin